MNSCHMLNACLINALHTANPKFEVRVDRVFHKHRVVDALHAISQSLHSKRISGGTCTHPQNVDTIFQAKLYMLRCSHLGSD